MVVSEDCILIHDAFPKAANHALVLPRDPSLHDIRNLKKAHIPLLMHMKVRPPLNCLLPPILMRQSARQSTNAAPGMLEAS